MVGKSLYNWFIREWAGVDPDDGYGMWYKDVVDADGNPIEYCTTWKPSNLYYNQDGGVSNSTNLNKIKYSLIAYNKGKMYFLIK